MGARAPLIAYSKGFVDATTPSPRQDAAGHRSWDRLKIGVRLAFARRPAISKRRTGWESSAMSGCVLVVDQGTTSTRAVVFGPGGEPMGLAQQEFPQIYPHPGWIEHDPEDLWRTTLATAREAIARAGVAVGKIAGVGIANQRETALVWERKTGAPISNAIVWQDRRTAERCAELAAEGHGPLVRERTGLVLDPYFSAAKIAWILDSVPGARDRAERGELAFGTVDSYLLWRLTEGAVHARSSTFARGDGTTSCWRCSACRAPCCRKFARPPPISASWRPTGSAPACRCWRWPAINSRR
jgi:hypothetical protein